MAAKSIGLQNAMVRESRVCDAGTETVRWKTPRLEREDKLYSCDIVDSFAVSD